jgi:hypothetical protein
MYLSLKIKINLKEDNIMLKPIEIENSDMIFGGNMKKLLPKYNEIPDEFKDRNTKWNKVFNDWFFCGLKNCKWIPKEGIDTDKALRHIKAIMGSWEPKHEHKEAGCAYLMSEFFNDVKYERAK